MGGPGSGRRANRVQRERVRALWEQGLSLRAIADQVGLTHEGLRQALLALGLSRQPHKAKRSRTPTTRPLARRGRRKGEWRNGMHSIALEDHDLSVADYSSCELALHGVGAILTPPAQTYTGPQGEPRARLTAPVVTFHEDQTSAADVERVLQSHGFWARSN